MPPVDLLEEQRRVEASWRQGWEEMFPGKPWPGLKEAMAKVRAEHDRRVQLLELDEWDEQEDVKEVLEDHAQAGARHLGRREP